MFVLVSISHDSQKTVVDGCASTTKKVVMIEANSVIVKKMVPFAKGT